MITEETTAAIKAENKRLKTENTRLKKKLGLPIGKAKKTPALKKSFQKMRLEKLQLNNRTISTLNKQDIFTVGQLVAKDHMDLLQLKNIGWKTISEIEKALATLNLRLEF